MSETQIDYKFIAAIKTIAQELKEANRLKRLEIEVQAAKAPGKSSEYFIEVLKEVNK